jgi:hypothetical protein
MILAMQPTRSLTQRRRPAPDATRAAVRGSRSLLLIPFLTAALAVATFVVLRPPATKVLDDFERPNSLVTNEYAYWHRDAPGVVNSPTWIMTSGSLFVRDHVAWTGVPDTASPGPASIDGTNSNIFRLLTRADDYGDATFGFRLRVLRFTSGPTSTRDNWDGVHVFVRYQNPALLYYVSVSRRDGTAAIKKKILGGDTNGGTYYTLATGTAPLRFGSWEAIRVSSRNNSDGSVTIRLFVDGRLLLTGRDTGAGDAPPITQPGRIGIRGDNTEFEFDDFSASRG